ncbi:MAG: hypothetical protein JSV89_00820 [Spirochaetaceae bacterium]|nr:MAG: hypothetical protein JSV89_00820 [Spirochaetaceae bacterium]
MEKTIYKLFLGKPKESWYELTEKERDSLQIRMDDALKKVGGKRIILCASAWSSERWSVFGVEEFPDIEAVQKLSLALHELEVWKYFENDSFLGIKF